MFSMTISAGRLSFPLLIVLCSVLAPACAALDRPGAMNQYVQTTLTDHNGLPQNSVNAIAQTTDGYLWFGTEEGLARFDGLHMTVFDLVRNKALADNFINTLAAGRDGSLWIGTRSGIIRLKDGVFRTWLTARSPIATICEGSDGAIWVGGLDGLYRLDGGKIDHYTTADGLPSDSVTSIVQGRDGTLWLGTSKGLASRKGSVLHPYGFLDGLSADPILDLASSQDGSLWIASARGLVRWNGKAAEAAPSVRVPEHARITSLLERRDGTLWMGFDHNGIASLNNREFTRYTAAQGLPADDVGRLFEDHDGNLWVGLFEGGTVELRDGSFSTFGKREGLSEDMVWSVLQARDGSLWVGTNNKGVDHIDINGRVQVYGLREGLPGGSIFALYESPDKSLWIGTEHGELSHLDHGRITVFHDPANRGARLNSIFADANGDLLLGYHEADGFVRFHHGQFQHYKVPGLLNAATIAADGSFWVGTDHGGVSHIKNGVTNTLTTHDGLLSNFAQAVYIDGDGVVWAGTSPGGLNRIANGRITTYSIDQGLYDLTVGAIVEDNDGYLWMTCNRGIYKVSKRELNNYAAGRVAAIHSTVYTTADGLRSAECNFAANPSVWKGVDGHLWFVTTAGIVTVDPAHSQVRTVSPSPLIEEIRFNRKVLPFEHGAIAGPGSGDVEIQFTAPDFVAPERVHFRYRLSGFESEWTEARERREAVYTKLPPGHYLFELQAADGDRGWDSKSAILSVIVMPHFWQTRWFRGVCGCVLSLLCFAVYRFRVRYLVEHARKLEEKVNQRTTELQLAIQTAEDAQRALREQAMKDSLTDLWNRRAIFEMLGNEILRAERDGSPITVLMADLDHFKLINDTYGHLTGDDVLQEVAKRIARVIRPYDYAGRYGGEEFLIVLPGCSPEVGAHRAEHFRQAIADTPIQTAFGPLTVTCSLGVASHRNNALAEELIQQADEALYGAKRMGRNCIQAGR
jgi:diguanylate cyclase (GGDEF)-like protein